MNAQAHHDDKQPELSSNAVVVLILASGQSQRFKASGGSGSKLEAELKGQPVLQHVQTAVSNSGLASLTVSHIQGGIGSSIAAGVKAQAQAAAWLILPGDLPLIEPFTLQQVAQVVMNVHEPRVVQPYFKGQSGHPVAFSAHYKHDLMALTGDQGARTVLEKAKAQQAWLRLDVSDKGVIDDIDTWQDLQRLTVFCSVDDSIFFFFCFR